MFSLRGLRGVWLAFALVAALAPASALAQTLTVSGDSVFGPSNCGDASQANTDAAIQLTYQYQPKAATTQATVQLFATKDACPAVPQNATSVTTPSDAIVLVAAGTNADTTSHTVSLKVSQLAQTSCATPQTTVWNVCFYEFYTPVATFGQTATPASSSATITVTYDSQGPGAPRLDAVSSGDQHLHVSFTSPGDSDIARYQVLAIVASATTAASASSASSGSTGSSGSSGSSSAASSSASSSSGSSGSNGSSGSGASSGSSGSGASTGSSSSSGSSGSSGSTGTGFTASPCQPGATVIGNLGPDLVSAVVPTDATLLTNGQTYLIQVQAIDTVGNAGACSNALPGTPQAINDFWRLYKADGGQDPGGCGQAGSGVALLALLGAITLLGLRRRKDATR